MLAKQRLERGWAEIVVVVRVHTLLPQRGERDAVAPKRVWRRDDQHATGFEHGVSAIEKPARIREMFQHLRREHHVKRELIQRLKRLRIEFADVPNSASLQPGDGVTVVVDADQFPRALANPCMEPPPRGERSLVVGGVGSADMEHTAASAPLKDELVPAAKTAQPVAMLLHRAER